MADMEQLGFDPDALRTLARRAGQAAKAPRHSRAHRTGARFQGVDREFRRAGAPHNSWSPR